MFQNYNYYPQNQNPQVAKPQYLYRQAPTVQGLKGRPVASLDEVRATSIDFDGSIFYFPDLANRRIYTKQINIDGTATLNMYEFKELTNEIKEGVVLPSVDQFVTKDEFERVLAELRQSLVKQTAPAPPQKVEVMNF